MVHFVKQDGEMGRVKVERLVEERVWKEGRKERDAQAMEGACKAAGKAVGRGGPKDSKRGFSRHVVGRLFPGCPIIGHRRCARITVQRQTPPTQDCCSSS